MARFINSSYYEVGKAISFNSSKQGMASLIDEIKATVYDIKDKYYYKFIQNGGEVK